MDEHIIRNKTLKATSLHRLRNNRQTTCKSSIIQLLGHNDLVKYWHTKIFIHIMYHMIKAERSRQL